MPSFVVKSILSVGVSILLFVSTQSCQTDSPDPQPNPNDTTTQMVDTTSMEDTVSYSFLALGDSYTIGESVDIAERWPVQLADSIAARGVTLDDPTIVAKTGWTTDELSAAIDATSLNAQYDLVSLLIGVNNQFRGYPFAQYESEFVALLNRALSFAGGNPKRVFVVSIPDYGVTPFGASYNPDKIARELDQYNAFADSVATSRGIAFFDITPISREAKDDETLVANDRLHPSGKMYTRWVELCVDDVAELFN